MSGYRASATPLFLIALLLASGCASMHHGRSQVVMVESEPPGARILVGGEPAGVTPSFVELKRRGAAVTLVKDGFLPKEIAVPRSVAMGGGMLGDALLSALFFANRQYASALSMVVLTLGLDLATGAAWELSDEVTIALDPAPSDATRASSHPEDVRGTPSDDPRTTRKGR